MIFPLKHPCDMRIQGCGQVQDNISLIRTKSAKLVDSVSRKSANLWIQHPENIRIDMTIRMYKPFSSKDTDHSQNDVSSTIKYTHYFVLSNG